MYECNLLSSFRVCSHVYVLRIDHLGLDNSSRIRKLILKENYSPSLVAITTVYIHLELKSYEIFPLHIDISTAVVIFQVLFRWLIYYLDFYVCRLHCDE